ncbi:hypothetical protein [Oceanobacillus alkalisoli]|uniref:hypothetical protein n=1 Tax=Oceanobacillus alkalisoli TaxID=2925113 RepID=UPI001EE45C96|nr:hypothetical protein [Oceanobacillus alkalisoli]MCG5102637.1 hypothetical protein [Oceanobacillus alkalisoli]
MNKEEEKEIPVLKSMLRGFSNKISDSSIIRSTAPVFKISIPSDPHQYCDMHEENIL